MQWWYRLHNIEGVHRFLHSRFWKYALPRQGYVEFLVITFIGSYLLTSQNWPVPRNPLPSCNSQSPLLPKACPYWWSSHSFKPPNRPLPILCKGLLHSGRGLHLPSPAASWLQFSGPSVFGSLWPFSTSSFPFLHRTAFLSLSHSTYHPIPLPVLSAFLHCLLFFSVFLLSAPCPLPAHSVTSLGMQQLEALSDDVAPSDPSSELPAIFKKWNMPHQNT